jgi:ADP-ribosylglycohydrolase
VTALTLRDRARGCLLGLAVGDALGGPVTGLKPGRVRQLFGEIGDHVDAREAWADRPHRWRLPGLHGAPTQQALTLIDVALRSGAPNSKTLDPRAVANLWCRLAFEPHEEGLRLGAHRACGRTFARALEAMRRRDVVTGQPSAGAGAAARVAPLGLVFAEDPEALSRAVIDVSLLTHTDPRAVAGALAVAHAAAILAVSDDPTRVETAGVMRDLIARVRLGEEQLLIEHLGSLHLGQVNSEVDPVHSVSRALEAVGPLIEEGDDDLALQTLVRQANRLAPAQRITSPNAGFAPATVPVALHLALAHPRFAQGVGRLVNEGRHASTAAAIAGAIAGLRLGEEAIPREWRDGLLAQEQIRLWADAHCGEEVPGGRRDLLEMELELTLREESQRRPLTVSLAKRREREERRTPPKLKRPRPEDKEMPFPPPPSTYLPQAEDPEAKRRARAARGRKRVEWKDERRRRPR